MSNKFDFTASIEKRISRLEKKYNVTVPGCTARYIYHTMIKDYGYESMLSLPPKCDETRFYTVFTMDGVNGEKYVYFYRNEELSPWDRETLSPAERRNKAAIMARRGFMSWDYVDNMPTR